MRCIFCDRNLLKSSALGHPITLSGVGICHSECAEDYLVNKRVFSGLKLKDLSDNDLENLYELILMERRERELAKKKDEMKHTISQS